MEKIKEAMEKEKKEHAATLASLNSDLAELKAGKFVCVCVCVCVCVTYWSRTL